MKKILRNVLIMMSIIIQHLNIKSKIKNHQKNTISLRKMGSSHLFRLLQSCVRKLYQHFVLIILDLKEYLHKSEVWVLLNFSMTDYTSQGKTRPKNPVDLSNHRSHQSYYTYLSRGATASETVIVQSFSLKFITCGASGYLRQ